MVFKARPKGKDAKDLLSTLSGSQVQKDNNDLYQTIFGLITITQKLQEKVIAAELNIEATGNIEGAIDPFANVHPFLFL